MKYVIQAKNNTLKNNWENTKYGGFTHEEAKVAMDYLKEHPEKFLNNQIVELRIIERDDNGNLIELF